MSDVYLNLDGREISLAGLDTEERKLFERLREWAQSPSSHEELELYWLADVANLYQSRGVQGTEWQDTLLYNIAADLCGQVECADEKARMPDYRDELAHISRTLYQSRSEFCQATGLAEDQFTATLAGYVHLFSPQGLNEALARIGYRLGIAPVPHIEPRPKDKIPKLPKRVIRVDVSKMRVSQMPEEQFQALVKLKEQYIGHDNAEILALIQGLGQLGYRLTILSDDESVVVRSKR